MMPNNASKADDSFGPGVQGTRSNFDLTLLFEDSFLAIAPSALLLCLLPFRTLWLYNSPPKVLPSSSRLSKVGSLAAFAALQLTLLILWIGEPTVRTRASIPAAGLTFASALALSILSNFEHSRSIRPSFLINVYLLLSLPFDVTRVRTLWLKKDVSQIAVVLTVATVIKAGILVLEAIEKRDILLARYRHLPPEATSGVYSRSLFWWLNPFIYFGSKKILIGEDLYAVDDDLTSISSHRRFSKAWDQANKSRKHALVWGCLDAVKWPLLVSTVPRLLLIGFKYAQPFLLNKTVDFVNASPSEQPDRIGWGLVGAYAVVYMGLAILSGAYHHMINRCLTMLRGGLVSMIYAKTLDLSITALNESESMTLMSADVERICNSMIYINDAWGAVIEVAIAVWLLYAQLGIAFVAPLVVSVAATSVTAYLAPKIHAASKAWIEVIQTRVAFTSDMLGSMRSVKLLGLTNLVQSLVQDLRVKEVVKVKALLRLASVRIILGNSTNLISPVATFAVFVIAAQKTGRTLNTATAYTALSLISILDEPLNSFISSWPMIVASTACFDRIQRFLSSPSRQDHRLVLSTAVTSRSSGSDDQHNVEANSASDVELRPLRAVRTNSASAVLTDDAVVVQNGSFSWSSEGLPVLHDITFRIRTGTFTIIIGPTGCGKSTLVKGILGETPTSQGFVYTSSLQAAFADQDTWIQNGSFRDNLLGSSAYEPEWYSQVVQACALDEDLHQFPGGDHTMVGSRGITLSGGQKQRLAMARAVYSRKDILIMDDVFSGLDADTEERIFTRLLGSHGLLKQHSTTIILVTHSVRRLVYADHIIALSGNGSVAEQGPFDTLRRNNGYVQSLAADLRELNDARPEEPATATLQRAAPDPAIDRAAADLARKTGDWQVYKHYFASMGWGNSSLFFVWVVLQGIFHFIPQLVVKWWTDAVVAHGNSVNNLYISIFAALSFGGLITMGLAIHQLFLVMLPKSAEDLHARLLKTVMEAPISFFSSADSGKTLNRFSQDMTLVDDRLPAALINISFFVVNCIMIGILMCYSAKFFAAILPVVLVVLYLIQKVYLQTSRQVRLLDLEAKAPLYSQFAESLGGLATIRAFGWTERFQENSLSLLDDSQRPYYMLFCIQRWLHLVIDLVVAGLAVVLMVMVVKLRTSLNAGFVGLALLNVMNFNTTLAYVIKEWTMLETSIGAISRLRDFSASTASELKPDEDLEVPPDWVPPEWPSTGVVEIKNFSASYREDSELVVKGVSLDIRSGEKIGICGRSGSGKSSLLASLFHMLEYRDGLISIDGVDVSVVQRQVLRTRVNAIPQEPYFLRGTVRFNADPWQAAVSGTNTTTIPDEEVVAALKKVDIWDVVSSKGGLDAEMDAEFLSHGQRQLFCLARAILRKQNSPILVLDEVSSSVDVKTDEVMQRIIREEFKDCTIIAVAHRLRTIVDFDKIAVLSAGELVEFDTPAKLLSRPSAFRELYET